MRFNSLVQLYKAAKSVSAHSNKTIFSQAHECLKLYFGQGKISPSEYYLYRLFDDKELSYSQKKEFIGWRLNSKLDRDLNAQNSHIISSDKLLFYSVLNGLGLPHPKLYAVAHPTGRFCNVAPSLNRENQLTDFIRNDITFPFFTKPIQGSFGAGSYLVNQYIRDSDKLAIADGRHIPLNEFVKSCFRPPPNLRRLPGQIFQEALRAHPVIESKCGPNISGLRLVVLMTTSGPHLFRAVWKVIAGHNFVDNYVDGKTGNLLGDVCLETGRIKVIIQGTGLERNPVTTHPDTGQLLSNFILPDWQKTIDLCMTASTIAPTLRFQHWDIALTPTGPQLLELNLDGSVDLPQLAGTRGLYDAQFRTAFAL